MGPEEIVNLVKEACKRLSLAYREQGKAASTYANKLDGALDQAGMWKCVFGLFHESVFTRVDWRDSKPSDWDTWVNSYKRLEFVTSDEAPGKPEAKSKMAELRSLEKELYGQNAESGKYNLDAKDLEESTKVTGEFIVGWLRVSNSFSKNVALAIPKSTLGISSGNLEGWLSPEASTAYEQTFAMQDAAAEATSTLISDLVNRTATLLSRLNGQLADLAQASVNEQKYLQDLIDAFPTEWNLGALKDAIAAAVSAFIRFQENQIEKLKITGSMLTDTIQQVVDIQSLHNKITEMGARAGDEGWPSPVPMSLSATPREAPRRSQLRYNTQYFKDHGTFWRDISATMNTLAAEAKSIPELPKIFTRVPEFQAGNAAALDGLGNRITELTLTKGGTVASDLANKLDETIGLYLKQEAENVGLAKQIYREIYGTDLP